MLLTEHRKDGGTWKVFQEGDDRTALFSGTGLYVGSSFFADMVLEEAISLILQGSDDVLYVDDSLNISDAREYFGL